MNLIEFIDNVYTFTTEQDFCVYVRENYEEIQGLFKGENYDNLYQNRYKISDLYYDIENNLLRGAEQEVVAFNSILADFFERFRFSAETQSLSNLLDDGPVKNRVKACILYLRIHNVNEYAINFDEILKNLFLAYEEEDFPKKLNLSLANYYFTAQNYLHEKYPYVLETLRLKFIENAENIPFLSNDLRLKIESGTISEENIREYINDCETSNYIQGNGVVNENKIEEGDYADAFLQLKHPRFEEIIKMNRNFLQEDLHECLGRGVEIIDDHQMLFQYIKSYGNMHKEKLIAAFEIINFKELESKNIEIIDWGCGQALATFVLLEYLKENKLNLEIKTIRLIEPSEIALKRGLLYLSGWNCNIKIKPIYKDLDSLVDQDIITNKKSVKIHLFSNILDVPSFKLNALISKIKKTQADVNYFFCVSPYIDESKNMRIETFYNNFEENYETILLSERKNSKDDDFWNCSNSLNGKKCKKHDEFGCSKKWTRYEKIFITKIKY